MVADSGNASLGRPSRRIVLASRRPLSVREEKEGRSRGNMVSPALLVVPRDE